MISKLEQGLYESSVITAWHSATKEGHFTMANSLLMGYEWCLQDHAYSGEPNSERMKERIEEVRFLQGLLYVLRTGRKDD
jgi:hypothetical protein